MKKNLLAALILSLALCPCLLRAQTAVFSNFVTVYEALSDTQRAVYDKFIPEDYEAEIQFLSYNPESVMDEQGLLTLDVPDVLLNSLSFKATRVEYESDTDLKWEGSYYNYDGTAATAYAQLQFVMHEGRIMGSISLRDKQYAILDLGGGVLLLTSGSGENTQNPGNDYSGAPHNWDDHALPPPPANTPWWRPNCGMDSLKILFVFTDEAADVAVYPTLLAKNCVASLNRTFANSNIHHTAHIAKVIREPDLFDDEVSGQGNEAIINTLDKMTGFMSNYAYIHQWRDQYKADIVVFMTKYMAGVNGLAYGIGTTFDSAFAMVRVSPAGLNLAHLTFAHEIGHLHGARHQFSSAVNAAPYAKAKYFSVNHQDFATIMFVTGGMGNSTRLEHFSNPGVQLMGQPTGDINERDNARRVSEWIGPNAAWYRDTVPFKINLDITQILCSQTGTATASIGAECYLGLFTPPYSYTWYESENGINWIEIPNSNAASINTQVTPLYSTMAGSFGAKHYRVKMVSNTIGLGLAAYATNTAMYNCPPIRPASGVAVLPQTASISIRPNPVQRHFAVHIELPDAEQLSIDLYSSSGQRLQQLYSGSLEKGSNKFNFELDFAAGNYILCVQGSKTTLARKLIVQ